VTRNVNLAHYFLSKLPVSHAHETILEKTPQTIINQNRRI